MSFTQTKKYRSLVRKREELEVEQNIAPVRHLIYLIDDYISKKLEVEALGMEQAQLEDRIHCAKEFVEMLRSA